MTLLRSLLFNGFFAVWGIIMAPILFLPLALASAKTSSLAGKGWAAVSLWMLKQVCGIRLTVRGREHIASTPVIYACKHQSAWDTLVMLVLLKWPAYVLKRELVRIPLWGWYLWRMKMIAIDRSRGAASLKQIVAQAKEALADGRPIDIYPEGTRTAPGAAPHYHSGITALYAGLGVPVVPVALNSGLLWGKNAFIKRPGTITMEFLPPIAPGLPKQEFMARLKDAIETASQRLLKDATSTG